MKRLLLLVLLASPLLTKAQSRIEQKQETDSVNYYQRSLDELFINYYDSLTRSRVYDSLTEAIKRLRKRSNNYAGPVVYGDILHSDLGTFNTTIVQNGFTPINAIEARLGFGWAIKTNRIMLDFYVLTAGINNISTKDSESIKLSLANCLQFDIGYDLINSKRLSIYPYGGISLRSSLLKFVDVAQPDSTSFANITGLNSTHHHLYAASTRIGFQAGIGIDYAIVNDKDKLSKIILFTKMGINRPIGTDRYSISGADYIPGIKQGDWVITVGVKFAWKR